MRDEFERVWPWLDACFERHGEFRTHSKEDVWRLIASGRACLWPGEKAAIVTELWNHPSGYRSIHGWLAAGELEEIKALVRAAEQMGRDMGCKRAVISGRDGWIRALGYERLSTRMSKVL